MISPPHRSTAIRNPTASRRAEPRYSVVVIGGGPAGMMAAISAATALRERELPGKVLLLEKNDRPGRKLLITGNGRCNITNASFCGVREDGSPMAGPKPGSGRGAASQWAGHEDVRGFCNQFGRKGRSLMAAMQSFGVRDTMRFFEGAGRGFGSGLPLKTEGGGRVFPTSDSASDVLDLLLRRMKEEGVTVQTNSTIERFEVVEQDEDTDVPERGRADVPEREGAAGPGRTIRVVHVMQRGIRWAIPAKAVIIATGGRSHPATGSSGDGYGFAKELGHTISSLRPGLVSLRTKEDWVPDLQGVSIENAKVVVLRRGKKIAKSEGDLMFTHDGISGPAIMDLSRSLDGNVDMDVPDPAAGAGGERNPLIIRLDLIPELDQYEFDQRLQTYFSREGDRMAGNCLAGFVPRKVAHQFVKMANIDNRLKINTITRDQRQSLIKLMKGLELTVVGHGGWDKAMITRGGVKPTEIDPKTLGSKLVDNLFFAGEVLDVDGPTGGYNLQACWSTGHLAGKNAGL